MKKVLFSLVLLAGLTFVNAQVTIFGDSFESYEDFTIEDFGGWIQVDNDGGETWGVTELGDFPNVNYIEAGMIFNAVALNLHSTDLNMMLTLKIKDCISLLAMPMQQHILMMIGQSAHQFL